MKQEGISLNKVSHRYGRQWALVDVSFTSAPGESVVVIGPNGCGKTTLLKILATRLSPTRGEGRIQEWELQRDSAVIRQQSEWLGHELGLYSKLTAAENLRFSFALRGKKLSDQRMDAVLGEVGLLAWKDRGVGELSIGMRKRLALARILIGEPRLIFLDEPHANLDREGKALMNQCIARWKKNQITLCLASHDHHEVLPLCDQVVVLDRGRLSFFGGAGQLPSGEAA